MKEQIKEFIKNRLLVSNGISIQTIALDVMGRFGPSGFSNEDYHAAYEELLADGEILRLEFADPAAPLRAKTILFVKGTVFLNLPEIVHGQDPSSSQENMVGKSSQHI